MRRSVSRTPRSRRSKKMYVTFGSYWAQLVLRSLRSQLPRLATMEVSSGRPTSRSSSCALRMPPPSRTL
eukprot:7099563-Pyramimonas_sp.AAC.1